jgi:HemX protein
MNLDGISFVCFGASYLLAFLFEVLALYWPQRINRWLRRILAAGGTTAHFLYISRNALPLQGGHSVLLLVSLILSIYYLSGTFHYPRTAWGLFVLPVILGLVAIARVQPSSLQALALPPDQGQHVWIWLHLILLLLGMVGLSVAFMASLMYLVKWSQLRHKRGLSAAVTVPSLERLETVHHRAVTAAFPLFSSGLALGLLLVLQTGRMPWSDPKVVSAALLWCSFCLLLLVRYLLHVRGRWVALLTVLAFLLMIATVLVPQFLGSSHPTSAANGGEP